MKTTGGEKTFSQYKEHPSIIPLEKRDEKCFTAFYCNPTGGIQHWNKL